MTKEKKKDKKKKNKLDNKYNADNEIIIGVTTKPKEKIKSISPKRKHQQQSSNLQKNTVANTQSSRKNSRTLYREDNTAKSKKKKSNDTKEEIKRRNKKRWMMSISMLFLIMIGGTIYLLTSPMFHITKIEMIGNEKNTAEMYISLSQIELGTTNIFSVTKHAIQNNLKENPYVEEVSIQRKLPSTLQMTITERKATYQVEFLSKFLLLNEQGYLLEISEDKQDLLIVKGLESIRTNAKMGDRLQEQDLKRLSFILEFTNYCKYHNIENIVTCIDVTDMNNYIVYFDYDEKILYLGNASNLNERLSLLKAILTSEKGKKGEIFMNGNITEDKVYFRDNS